tara:strand:+ start:440 stop:2149 length:1710 start_codon:yes stop_codon:yes gene_type:complete
MTPQALKDSLPLFVTYVWRNLGLPDPTPVQVEICQYLQTGPRRRGVQAFRGVGKSWLTSAYVLWMLWNDPELKVLVVSASKERSDSFSIFCKRLMADLPVLQHMQPDKRQGDRDSNVAFDIRGCAPAHAPSVKSVGITGQTTGSRADLIVADDVEVPSNSETAAMREKLRMLVAELGGAILTPESKCPHGGMLFLGTPQCEDTLYAHLPEAGYEFRVWPAEVPETAGPYKGQLAPTVVERIHAGDVGEPTDPARFSSLELEERQLEYGRIGYQLQFQLNTTLSDEDRHPLKLRDFIVMQTDVDIAPDKIVWGSGEDQELPQYPLVGLTGDRFFKPLHVEEAWSPYEGSIMYIDPSGRGQDQTAYAVVKQLHGMLILRKWGGLEGGYDEQTLSKLAAIAREEKVGKIVVESNFGDGMFASLLKPVLQRVYPNGCGIEDDHVTGQKEARIIDNLEPVLASHRLIIDEDVVRHHTLDRRMTSDPNAVFKTPFYQMTRLTRERGCLKHDDLIDALGGAIRYWTERMSRDVDHEVKTREDERLQEALDDFVNGILLSGKDPRSGPQSWAQVKEP